MKFAGPSQRGGALPMSSEVVERVQPELQRGHEQDRHAPGRAAVGDREGHSERGVERRDVAQVVVVARAERPDVVEEQVRREREQRRQHEVDGGEREEPDAKC